MGIVKFVTTDGLVLKTNGVIGMQGMNTPFALSSGNQWLGTFTNSKTLVMDAGSSAQYSNLIVKNNSNEYPQPQSLNKTNAITFIDNYGTSAFNTPASIFTVTSANPNCPAPQSTGMRMAQADTSGSAYMKAVKDTALYNLLGGPEEGAVIIEETREINRAYVYSVLASGYNTSHAGLMAFYVQQSDSAVAHYHAVDSLLQDGNYYAAQTQNAQTTTATQIQYNQQKVNEALIRYGIDPQAGFTQDELDELMAFANSCPLQQGPAVYQVRTLLSVLYNNALTFTENCAFESKGARKAKAINSDKTENSFTLYPNPNNGVMYLNYTLSTDASVTIYDISGRVLYQHVLSSQNKLLQIKADLANGVYFYSINDEVGKLLQTNKIIIVK